MDGEGDQYEDRLRDVFQSFDGSGAGSLSPEELAELCHTLHLGHTTLHTLLLAPLNAQDQLPARVEFEQFKNALILVLSSTEETPENEGFPAQPDSPEVQPRFVKGGKRYGRRSLPEFAHASSGLSPPEKDNEASGDNDGTLPSKRECWNVDVSSPDEYEADGQLHLWNPDDPGTPCGSLAPLAGLEERVQQACQQLSLPLNGTATLHQLRALCQHLGMEVGEDVLHSVGEDCVMSIQAFVCCVLNSSKPPTPSASTPYRQLKRHHSTQTFDETGRRISSVMSSTIGLRLFSTLDDGTGHTAVEQLLDTWLEEGVDNGCEILQALDFSLDGRINLSELSVALENELLGAKNSIHQAALASFKTEIRHLLERVDLELRQKEKIISDLEKAEKLKSQLASEVDENHSAIERINDLNLRKLEQEHKERMVALRTELSKEVELVQQQANQQREELEHEINRIREDETFLREQFTLSVKENGRLHTELLENTQHLLEAEAQLSKVQRNLDSVLKEKFGDLDLSNAELYQQEERLRQLRSSYEEQCRELQDRIDELQLQLEEYRASGRTPHPSLLPSLCDELQGQSSGMDSDQGLGCEGQPFNMSLEAEMMLEQLREQHVREIDNIRAQLDSTVNDYQHRLEEQHAGHEEERRLLSLHHQQEVQAVKEELTGELERAQSLHRLLEEERRSMEVRQGVERAELCTVHQQELSSLSQEAQDARSHALQLEEQLGELKEREREDEKNKVREREELSRAHTEELTLLKRLHKEALEVRLQEDRASLQGEREEALRRLAEEGQRERQLLEESHAEVLRVRLKEAQQRADQEQMELERRLGGQWDRERQQLEEGNKAALEKELARLLKEQEEREKSLTEQWDKKCTLLEEQHHAEMQQQLLQERERLKEVEGRRTVEWDGERAQLQEQYKEELQASLAEQRDRLQVEREEQERRWQEMGEEKQGRMDEVHRQAMQELSVKHDEEKKRLSCMLEKLHTDIGEERCEAERLAEENLILRQKISALREEDLRENQQELKLQVEHLKKEKNASQKMADGLKRQVSELRRRGLQLEEENCALSQQNAKHMLTVDALQHTLEEVIRHGSGSSNERSEIEAENFTASVSRTEKLEEEKKLLRAELNRCVEKLARLRSVETQLAELLRERQTADKHQQALRAQLIKAQEKVQALDSTLQGLTQQNARLKSDLRVTQQEGDALKQEVILLHKQLQNASEKCQLVEMSVSGVSSGSQQGRRVWAELSRLREAELMLLREANQRLQRELTDARLELSSAREKARQLEVLVLSVKQQKQQNQASLAKAAEQERSALKREIEALQTQLHNKLCDSSEEQREMESLQEENDRLRNKQTVLEAQLMEAQLFAMLPQSPHHLSGEQIGRHHGDEMNPDLNVQVFQEQQPHHFDSHRRSGGL
ncbi:ninein isoform X2 [Electrophorus electricus]|uniref:ninein isoform X2 n=1 Tax=Electrophorus electricus TaxID=8005 RepID=UPI0015D036BD|nr:ninein isoform X2 [Electrophorus electricus]